MHPTPDRFEAYVEGTLAAGDRAVLESHLVTCGRCQAEVEEWRALFTGLAALPRFAPAPGFMERVLAGVQVREPWAVRAAAWIRRLVPRTTRGWALAAAFLALPVITSAGALGWLLTRPMLTLQGLWLFTRDRVGDAVATLVGRSAGALVETPLTSWLVEAAARLQGTGLSDLGAAAAVFGTMSVVSAWILYQYLLHTPTRKIFHASFSF